ncbi:MAG: hypothetical protein HND55_02055 [Pseudomonadota bacterium]|nr:MAG: hypothetical protein HND55_02055 [Pseudomonadota bacterium]
MGQVAHTHDQHGDIQWMMAAMARMFRPLIRFSVGRVSCSALVDMIKELYVAEAREHLQQQNPDRRVTYSSLALLCGIDGRAIQAIERNSGRTYTASDVCSEAAILEMWSRDTAFTDPEAGTPNELLIHGPQRTFQQLVTRAAGRMVTVQTALSRLLESGNVALNEDETKVRMIDYRYMPLADSDPASIESGSLAISRLGRSILHNTNRVRRTGAPWLQQDRWSTAIPASKLRQVREAVRRILETNIGEVETCLEREEIQPYEHAQCSVGVGWYYWESSSEE